MSITPPALVVKETTPGIVFLKDKNSAVVIPRVPTYLPIVRIREAKPIVITVNSGSTGPAGEKGSGDLHYKYVQGSASEQWIIEHDLGKYPSITVQDSANENVEGYYEYPNTNKVILNFSAAFSGVAYLN